MPLKTKAIDGFAYRRSLSPSAEGLTDEALIHLVAEDSPAAMEELSVRYRTRVERLGMQLLGDEGLAEELAQETFVRLWRRASTFSVERGTAATFLFTIARRIAIDLWRRPSSRPFNEPTATAQSAAAVDQIAPLVTGLAVHQALGTLSPSHREVLELGFFRHCTQAEIADRLNLPLGTVKSRTYHALRALKVVLADRNTQPKSS